jgi:trimeric autotransporter adhesin
MATVTAGRSSPIRFDLLDITGWLTGTVSGSSPTGMIVTSPAGGYRRFAGSGFTFGADGLFSGGTINSVALSASGGEPWSISGMSMPVATLKAYVAAGNTAGFLAAAFAGNDTLSGNATLAFHDYLDGFGGHDKLYGGNGNDTLNGGLGNDTIDGQVGIDRMVGGGGDDTYFADSESDVIVEMAGGGLDTVLIADVYSAPAHVENLTLLPGAALAVGNELGNRIVGNDDAFNGLEGLGGNDTIIGGKGVDQIVGDEGNDSLDGGDGDDEFFGLTGKDTMIGGAGNDSFDIDDTGDLVIEALGGGVDHVQSSIDYTLSANVENLSLYADLHIDGKGNGLNNTLWGSYGNNVLDGGAGADTMIGANGNDTYVVDSSGDIVEEILFDDFATGYDTVQSLISFNLTADGDRVKGDLEALFLTGTAAINGTGNALGNTITGNGAANTLTGLDGNDRLDGGAGADKLIGGKGNDTYTIDNAFDTVVDDGGDKYDAVRSTIGVNLAVVGGGQIEDAYLLGTAAINAVGNGNGNLMMGNSANNKLTGDGGNDTLYGVDGNDTLEGGSGADVLLGGKGDDHYYAGGGDTVVEVGGSGSDTVFASASFDLSTSSKGDVEDLTLLMGAGGIDGTGNGLANLITGNDSNNLLMGLDGKDTLLGGNGNDTVNGGLGDDSLAGFFGDDVYDGGAGTNTLNLGAAGAGNETINHGLTVDAHDIILQFDGDAAGGQDVLNLDALFDALGVATASRAGRVALDDRGTAVDVFIDVDGVGEAEYLAATINSASLITVQMAGSVGDDVLVGTL